MRYRVAVPVLVVANASVEVEADSPEAALDAAGRVPSHRWEIGPVHGQDFDVDLEDNDATVDPIDDLGRPIAGAAS